MLTRAQIERARRENRTLTIKQSQRGQFHFDFTIYPLNERPDAGTVILIDDITQRVTAENMLIQRDKMSSMGELAGTLAQDPNSRFNIHSIAFDREGHCTVKVPTIGGRRYKLRGSFDLAAGRWIDFDEFETPEDAEPGMMELALPPGAAAQFNRLFFNVEVSLPGQP